MPPPSAIRSIERRGGGIRPALLAAGMALMWFVEFQGAAVPTDAPGWATALLLAGRLFADFVGAALVVAAARLILAAFRLGLTHWRLQRSAGGR
jgi:hypothetical protein